MLRMARPNRCCRPEFHATFSSGFWYGLRAAASCRAGAAPAVADRTDGSRLSKLYLRRSTVVGQMLSHPHAHVRPHVYPGLRLDLPVQDSAHTLANSTPRDTQTPQITNGRRRTHNRARARAHTHTHTHTHTQRGAALSRGAPAGLLHIDPARPATGGSAHVAAVTRVAAHPRATLSGAALRPSLAALSGPGRLDRPAGLSGVATR